MTCAHCKASIKGSAVLCEPCLDSIEQALADLPALAAELEVTYTRQSRTSRDHARRTDGERPVPWHDKASNHLRHLHSTLTHWTAMFGEPGVIARPIDTITAMSGWLMYRRDTARISDHAPAYYRAITTALRDGWALVDLAPELTYAGPCGATTANGECDGELYAQHDQPTIECPTCHTEHDVKERRAWLLDAINDRLASATEISRALTQLDDPVTSDRIWQWVHCGRLAAHGTDRDGYPTYRVGDVRDLIADDTARRRERDTRRAKKHSA